MERRRRRRERRERRNVLIRRLAAEGKGIKPIARELGLDPKTVRKVLRPKGQSQPPRRPSLLDPFRPLIRHLVQEKDLTAVRILEEIKAVGYQGGYTILKDYVRTLRPKSRRRPHLRFETEPGVQGQVDLSPYTVLLGETPTKVVAFSFVLGFSRWQFLRFMLHADVHAVCHQHVIAFDEAGGVPVEILYDRMKQVVLESHKDGVVFHPLFEKMMHYYGFRAVPLAPGYKEGKGKVEAPFWYVEVNFLAGRRFRDLADLNHQAVRWLAETARVRIHRTTQERPIDRLLQERPSLLPLPSAPFQAAVVEPRCVGADFCVSWKTNRYSVPPRFAGTTAWLYVLEGLIQVQIDGQVVAAHPERSTRHQRYLSPEHEAEFREPSTSRHVLGEQFRRLGPSAEAFADGLAETKGAAAGYHMSRILKLADRAGQMRVGEALRHALRYGAFDYKTVERIVAVRQPPQAVTSPASTCMTPSNLGQYLRGVGTHQRDPEQYRHCPELIDHSPRKPGHKKEPDG